MPATVIMVRRDVAARMRATLRTGKSPVADSAHRILAQSEVTADPRPDSAERQIHSTPPFHTGIPNSAAIADRSFTNSSAFAWLGR